MLKKRMIPVVLLTAVTSVLLCAGCKKEEQASPAPAQSAAPATMAALVSYDFESGAAGWTGTDKTVKAESATDQKHGGNTGLKVSGTAGNGRWNFAASPKFALEPGKKYKLTGWMLVESWDKGTFPPLFKCAVMQDNKWLSNAFSKKYDLKKMKEWQSLGTIFEVPAGATTGFIALEKGTQDPLTATVYLDDIKIEAVQ